MTVLIAENLQFSFGSRQALRGVSLSVERGEIFGLIGPDGAGKTTLIRIFCGLLTPSAGTCQVLGFDTVRDKRRLIQKIGYLSQRFSLYTDLTVWENLSFFGTVHGVRDLRERGEGLLRTLGLAPFSDRLAGALSGGMQQKLALAVSLIHTPEVIFLDEPTNGVDPVARREFWDILAEVARQGTTIVISTPYLDEAERCSRVAFLSEGRLLSVVSPREAKQRLREQFIEVSATALGEVCAYLRSLPGVLSARIVGDRVRATLSADTDTTTLRAHLESAASLRSFRVAHPLLEDVYVALLEQEKGGPV